MKPGARITANPKLSDVQSRRDYRRIGITKVGVKGLRYPILVLDRQNGTQHTIAAFNMYVNLSHRERGTHMSRFIEVLNRHRGEVNLKSIPVILDDLVKKLKADSAHLEVEFPYFLEKSAPVTGAKSMVFYTCRFLASTVTPPASSRRARGRSRPDPRKDFRVEVEVPVISLCPCSKEISRIGAHNQRSLVAVRVRYSGFFWIEDLIGLVEESSSAPIYSLLKRPDEKFITERAFSRPRFAEDIAREVAARLRRDKNFTWFKVEVESFESIHSHNAYAYVEEGKTVE